MICPLCGARKARRACPALGHDICSVCCGTKRLTQIRCPPDCIYLAAAREHPPAAAVRQQQRDLAAFVAGVRDLNRRQAQLFLAVNTFVARHQPELHTLADDDVVDACAALAATYETAARGVIYEHRPATRPGERLIAALRPLLTERGEGGGSAFERDAAVVLRRVEELARATGRDEPANRRAYLDLIERVLRRTDEPAEGPAADQEPPSRLIVP